MKCEGVELNITNNLEITMCKLEKVERRFLFTALKRKLNATSYFSKLNIGNWLFLTFYLHFQKQKQ